MKNTLDIFFIQARNEFGEKIDFSTIETEGFSGVIFIEDRFIDINVTINECHVFENELTESENKILNEFIIYTQTKMQEQKVFIKNTENGRLYSQHS
ncbi:hypothetical protein N6B72_04885 [Chryseobacterium soli]|uniref:hypothetical protein n=1 Tax=Chryseobacterium soli TaxID=445961 RepID=UPI002954D61D|nr:hypothetical protein [Chryseobacterium soli]MDV7696253.1 hypothetical protein [Chryseobacterium soli]